jgi:hypothetical protein
MTEECVNCNRQPGEKCGLSFDEGRFVDIVLCEGCLDSYLEEDWISLRYRTDGANRS